MTRDAEPPEGTASAGSLLLAIAAVTALALAIAASIP